MFFQKLIILLTKLALKSLRMMVKWIQFLNGFLVMFQKKKVKNIRVRGHESAYRDEKRGKREKRVKKDKKSKKIC